MNRKEIISRYHSDSEFAKQCLENAPLTHQYPNSKIYRMIVDKWQFFIEVYSNGSTRLIY